MQRHTYLSKSVIQIWKQEEQKSLLRAVVSHINFIVSYTIVLLELM
jgi:hypothetical protein